MSSKRQAGKPLVAVLSFEVRAAVEAGLAVLLMPLGCCPLPRNLGDQQSTITHPATTTHGRLTPEKPVLPQVYATPDPRGGRSGRR